MIGRSWISDPHRRRVPLQCSPFSDIAIYFTSTSDNGEHFPRNESIIQIKTPMNYYYKTMKSPVGELTLIADDQGLSAVLWENDKPGRVRLEPLIQADSHPMLMEAERQLIDYFSGKRSKFTMPLSFKGTEFQKKVWKALVEIPFGETRSYAQIAQEIGHPKAVRAVGAANGKNPISIIAPCHRVIGSSGKLTGFAGGLVTKAFLLDLEKGPLMVDHKIADSNASP
jgi:methylated-DNA-[protein]-cysteine S-methyltransferase